MIRIACAAPSRRLLLLALLSFFVLAAQVVLAANIVYLVRTGTDAEGNPAFRMADGRDTHLSWLFELTQSSRGMHEVARYYDSLQKDKLAASLQGRGLSSQDTQYALSSYPTEPVFIEVSNARSGSYNDWKGRFSVVGADGQAYTYSTPRVVFALGSDVVRSGNRALIEQTLVHEVAHGGMSQGHGRTTLPETPWLSRPHSGGSVTDEQLAYIEGWAEFVGTYFTGRRTIAEDPEGAMDSNWYAYRSDGQMKSGQELVRTEGWNASVLYRIATAGASQNAMWKMTQVMSRTRPQSMMQLLTGVNQYFPELAPTVNQVLYQYSGGQIAGSGAGGAVQYAGAGGGGRAQPYYGGGSGGSGGGQWSGGATLDRLDAALMGQDDARAYAGYDAYRNYQRTAYGQGDGSGAGSWSQGGITQDTDRLALMYHQKQQELARVPWWKFWEKSRIQKDLAMIEDLYSRQLALAQYAAAPDGSGRSPATSPAGPQATPVAPAGTSTAGPLSPRTYRSVVDAAASGDSAALQQSLEAHRQAFESRRTLRGKGPARTER
jgi:hypothetical protein